MPHHVPRLGLHFPEVTFVGVLGIDNLMALPDFRAMEKAYQLLVQVSGRAGREHLSGKVYLTSTEPYQYMFTLTDGMNVLVNVFSQAVIQDEFGVKVDGTSVVFIVDVNGDRRPNRVGSDIFAFVLRDETIVPAGEDSTYNCNTAGLGLACTARVMRDNYSISYY